MRKKILYYPLEKRDSTSWWRVVGILPFIYHEDIDLCDISDTKIFDWTVFSGASALLIQRPFAQDHLTVIMGAKNSGLKIITDYDDDLTCVDMFNPTHQLYQQFQNTLKECLKLSDEVWVSTQAIFDSYKQYNSNIHIIPNAHNDYFMPVSKKRAFNMDSRKVFWRGGMSHSADVLEKADELIKIINENPNWDFNFCGSRFEYIEMRTGDNHNIVQYMSMLEFFRYFNSENPNITIFPLRTTPFNRAKSNISWMEATYAGSSFFGNTDLPEFNQSGVYPISTLPDYVGKDRHEALAYANKISWELICDTLLLSNINKIRLNRLLEI